MILGFFPTVVFEMGRSSLSPSNFKEPATIIANSSFHPFSHCLILLCCRLCQRERASTGA